MNPAKRAAIELSQLRDKKITAGNLRERAAVNADKLHAVKTSTQDEPVKQSSSNDKYTELLAANEQLEKEIRATDHEIKMIEEGIKQLDPEQQMVLNVFYLKFPKHSGKALNYLCEKLNINERSVWEKKKAALNRYAKLQGFRD